MQVIYKSKEAVRRRNTREMDIDSITIPKTMNEYTITGGALVSYLTTFQQTVLFL